MPHTSTDDFIDQLRRTPHARLLRFMHHYRRFHGGRETPADMTDMTLRAEAFCAVDLFWVSRREQRYRRDWNARFGAGARLELARAA